MAKNNSLDGMIEDYKAKLERVEAKQNELSKKARAYKAEIEKLELMKNNQQFNALSSVLNDKGISIDDIQAAIAAGNVLALQDMIDSAASKAEKAPVVTEGEEPLNT